MRPRETREAALARFWSFVEKCEGDGCWPWRGRVGSNGYGRFGSVALGGKHDEPAHRVMMRASGLEIPPRWHVCHRCDNPLCVRPDHLFLGTNLDNIADRDAKGRQNRGEEHPLAKLTEETVMEIRRRYATGRQCQRYLGRLFGVAQRTISHNVHGATWKHVG